jgi:hypothetical protein
MPVIPSPLHRSMIDPLTRVSGCYPGPITAEALDRHGANLPLLPYLESAWLLEHPSMAQGSIRLDR